MGLERLLGKVLLCIVFLFGSSLGVPMRPEDIESLLHANSKVEESAEDEEEDYLDNELE